MIIAICLDFAKTLPSNIKLLGLFWGRGAYRRPLPLSPPALPPFPFQTINSCQAYVKDEIIGAREALITLFWRDCY